MSETLDQIFQALAATWRADTMHLSSASAMARHPAYAQIIALGPAVVPLILRDLMQSPDHWFVALHVITGTDPVRPEHEGDIEQMANDWLCWGRERGII